MQHEPQPEKLVPRWMRPPTPSALLPVVISMRADAVWAAANQHGGAERCLNQWQPGVLSLQDMVAGAILAAQREIRGERRRDVPLLELTRRHTGADTDTAGWGLSPSALARALEWRYPSTSYVWQPLATTMPVAEAPPTGRVWLCFAGSEVVLIDPSGRRCASGLAVDEKKEWKVYELQLPSERMVARTTDNTPMGLGKHPRYYAMRALLERFLVV